MKLLIYLKTRRDSKTGFFSCAYCEIFKSTYFEEHLRTAVSVMLYSKKFFLAIFVCVEPSVEVAKDLRPIVKSFSKFDKSSEKVLFTEQLVLE